MPPSTKAGFIAVRKLSGTFQVAFMPPHFPRQVERQPEPAQRQALQGHSRMVSCALKAFIPAPASSQMIA